jgi:hypothetical protein
MHHICTTTAAGLNAKRPFSDIWVIASRVGTGRTAQLSEQQPQYRYPHLPHIGMRPGQVTAERRAEMWAHALSWSDRQGEPVGCVHQSRSCVFLVLRLQRSIGTNPDMRSSLAVSLPCRRPPRRVFADRGVRVVSRRG